MKNKIQAPDAPSCMNDFQKSAWKWGYEVAAESYELRLNEALVKVEQTKDQVDLFESIVDGARHYLKATEQESVQSAAFRVAKERDEALAKLAEATKDKQRLDWLSSKPHYEEFVKRIPAIAFWHLQLRAAIDDAMKASDSPHHNAN